MRAAPAERQFHFRKQTLLPMHGRGLRWAKSSREHLQQRMLTEGNYSMTSSARASNEGGTAKPMAPGLCSSVAGNRPNCDDLALHRFFPGSVGDDDAACRLHVLFDPAHDHAVMQREKLHGLDLATSSFLVLRGCAAIGAPAL